MSVFNDGVQCAPLSICVSCRSSGAILHTGLQDLDFGAPGAWAIRQCENRRCGLAWADPQPLPSEIGKLYLRYYTHDVPENADGAPIVRSFDSRKPVKLAKQLLATLFPWRRRAFQSDRYFLQGRAPGRVLDIGCGNGVFLGAMAEQGWEAHGIDFDTAAIAAARRYPGVTASVGDVISRGYPSDHFDAVVMSNVIEHVPNPVEVFAECYRILGGTGRLVMITPNLESLGHRLFGRDWRGLEPPRHLFLFQKSSMRRLARRAGFSRFEVFTSPGDSDSHDYIIEASQQHREQGGRKRLPLRRGALKRKERVLDLLGWPRGEWIVLVADK